MEGRFLFILLVVAVVAVASDSSADELWNQYGEIHADLSDVFHSKRSLEQANKFSTNQASCGNAMCYCCACYGCQAAADLVCFIAMPDAPNSAKWKFTVPNGAALKLHSSIYTVVEASNRADQISALRGKSLVAQFRPEFFDPEIKPDSDYENDSAGYDHFRDVIRAQKDYSSSVPEHFFWTAGSTQDFYQEHQEDASLARDVERAEKWGQLAALWKAFDAKTDTCSFSKLENAIELQPGSLIIPLWSIADIAGKSQAAACLAYLAASVATDTSVNHLAVTNPAELLNYRARSIQQSAKASSSLNDAPYTKAGLLGGGQIVQITDSGVDMTSCYFNDPKGNVAPSDLDNPTFVASKRKVIEYAYNGCGDKGDEPGGHGTHVSGTAVGNIIAADLEGAGKYDGVAPDGKLVFVDLGQPGTGLCIPPANQLYKPGYNAGARVSSNSWGAYYNGRGYYSSQDVDLYLYKRPQSLILFAAGNNGGGGPQTLTMEGTTKNSLSVGSSETTYGGPNITYVAFYSSKGPTYDNRIKPDLVAPGDVLVSALSNGDAGKSCGTTSMTGTSMATPAAAGAALLARDYFMTANTNFWAGVCKSGYRFCGPFTPSGVLIKALLVSSGSQMALYHGGGPDDIPLGEPPDTMQGFGRVTLANVLPLKGVYQSFDLFVDDLHVLAPNQAVTYSVSVSNTSVPLRATLAWYDPPAVGGSTGRALIHDLDLVATSPSGLAYYGNGNYNGAKNNKADTLNNVEQIVIQQPAKGNWKVVVQGKAMPYAASQQYSLVITSGGSVKE